MFVFSSEFALFAVNREEAEIALEGSLLLESTKYEQLGTKAAARRVSGQFVTVSLPIRFGTFFNPERIREGSLF